MDYAVGDKLSLIIDAINPEQQEEILFPKGTVVSIDAIKGKIINLKFPDGIVYAHEAKDFQKITPGKMYTKNHAGLGTPPKEIFALLPKEADWKKNYVWKINVSLEEKTDKKIICQNCTTEIVDFNKKDEIGDIYCPACKTYIVPFDLTKNELYAKPFNDINDIFTNQQQHF